MSNVFRVTPESGHRSVQLACLKRACHEQTFRPCGSDCRDPYRALATNCRWERDRVFFFGFFGPGQFSGG
jgi:hypothetical protein